MSKKMFAFGGLVLIFVIGLFCMGSCFSYFTNVAFDNAIDAKAGNDVAYAIGYLLVSTILLAASVAGIVLMIIFTIKKKELKFPLFSIIVLGCAAIMLISYNIMNIVSNATIISDYARYMKNNDNTEINFSYFMSILSRLLNIFINLAITFIIAALGVLSLVNFQKKKLEFNDNE